MPAPPYIALLGQSAVATVRSARTAADAPAAGAWTPDNRNADEQGGGELPTDFILDSRAWQSVRLFCEFTGAFAGGESVEVEVLHYAHKTAAPGRNWIVGEKVTLAPNLDSAVVATSGQLTAYRITSLALNGGTNVTLKATGGDHREHLATGG